MIKVVNFTLCIFNDNVFLRSEMSVAGSSQGETNCPRVRDAEEGITIPGRGWVK